MTASEPEGSGRSGAGTCGDGSLFQTLWVVQSATSACGSWLYDNVVPQSPLVVVAAANAIVCAASVSARVRKSSAD